MKYSFKNLKKKKTLLSLMGVCSLVLSYLPAQGEELTAERKKFITDEIQKGNAEEYRNEVTPFHTIRGASDSKAFMENTCAICHGGVKR